MKTFSLSAVTWTFNKNFVHEVVFIFPSYICNCSKQEMQGTVHLFPALFNISFTAYVM
jgi:hypothetical protein